MRRTTLAALSWSSSELCAQSLNERGQPVQENVRADTGDKHTERHGQRAAVSAKRVRQARTRDPTRDSACYENSGERPINES